MKILILILSTGLLTGCQAAKEFKESYEFGDLTEIAGEIVEINENQRQHKCNMDITQCSKYGLEPTNPRKRAQWCKADPNCKIFSSGNE